AGRGTVAAPAPRSRGRCLFRKVPRRVKRQGRRGGQLHAAPRTTPRCYGAGWVPGEDLGAHSRPTDTGGGVSRALRRACGGRTWPRSARVAAGGRRIKRVRRTGGRSGVPALVDHE